ncbi:MAG: DUF3306 domain-containing protein [Polaromonas sp.]
MAEEEPGFLGRWSRRKTGVLKGKPLEEPVVPATVVPMRVSAPVPVPLADQSQPEPHFPDSESGAEPPKPLLSLDDVERLTKDSDFKPFMAHDVGPEVRNAAMKKLFADPHYNVMDGLDIYIDDYSKSDPIPESMLRQMVGAKLLKLFDDEDEQKEEEEEAQKLTAPVLPDNPNNPNPETVAQSSQALNPSVSGDPSPEHPSQPEPAHDSGASQHEHAHSHLRLQPDNAPPAPETGRGHQ